MARALFRKEDFNYIQKRILTPRKNELVVRSIFSINNETPTYSHTFEVENVQDTGSAQVVESGADSDNIPFVGESVGSQKGVLFKIRDAIRITEDDLEAADARRQSGKGSEYPVQEKRLDAARRFIAESENKLGLHGFVKAGKIVQPGLLNWPGVVSEPVSGANTDARLFSGKTPQVILKDIIDAKKQLEGSGKFKAAGILISDEDYLHLLNPYSESTTITILQWLLSHQDLVFPKGFIRSQDITPQHSGFKDGNTKVGGFAIFDDSADVAEFMIARDLEVVQTPWDEYRGEMKIKCHEKVGGIYVYQPKGIVIRTGSSKAA
jgi:hypothetical protein